MVTFFDQSVRLLDSDTWVGFRDEQLRRTLDGHVDHKRTHEQISGFQAHGWYSSIGRAILSLSL